MSQEIQLVNSNLPLQPAIGGQQSAPLAYTGLPETTPLRRVHQLLRGRYALAFFLAGIGAVVGAAVGFILPRPMWESVGILKVQPLTPTPDAERVLPMWQNFLADVMVELKTERCVRQAMQNPAWKALRPYPGNVPPPEQVAEFAGNLSVKNMSFTQTMIQVSYDDSRKDGKDVAQVAVKSTIEAFQQIWADNEAQEIQKKIDYQTKLKDDETLAITADQRSLTELTKEGGDDEAAMLQAHITNLITLEKSLRDARLLLKNAQHDIDLHRAGLNGPQLYTAEEIARVDGTMLARLTARNEARLVYQDLMSQYGPAYPKCIEAKHHFDLRQQDIADAVKLFNDSFFIQQPTGGGPAIAVSKDLSKLTAIVDEYSIQYNTEDQQIKAILSRHAQVVTYRDDIEKNKAMILDRNKLLETLQFEKEAGATFSVVDDGSVPAPAGDRRPVFAALGFIGGGAIPVCLLLLVGLINPRYRFSDETGSDINGINLLGILPDLPDRLSDPEQASIAAHCVHQIRTMLQINGAPEERRVVAITSAAPGDGKTSLTLALGLSYAACGARTLLIDCDLVGAGLTARMNVSSPAGVLEAIANRSLFEYVRSTDVADVTILPVGSAQTLHASTLSPAALRRLIDEARKQYDTILIDTGPILGSIEASLVCAAADAVVLTVARGQQRPLVEKAIQRLTGIGAKVAGVVFNRAQSGDFDRTISGASSLRSPAASGNGHNGHDGPRYGTLGRAVHTHNRQSEINEG